MSDIVERIKAAIPYTDTEAEDDILREALKEIERLKGKIRDASVPLFYSSNAKAREAYKILNGTEQEQE